MRAMFHTIAPRYDFITRMFSYGMDPHWKRVAVRRAHLPDGALVLDLACGTGDFTVLARGSAAGVRTVAADLTERMLRLARERVPSEAVCADASRLPFRDGVFDAVFTGYGLRNFQRLDEGLAEICRVTRPGGLLVSLDFFLPANPLLRAVFLAYLYVQGCFWGLVLHGRPRVYTYIPDSLRAFVSIPGLSRRMGEAGYKTVESRSYILGGIGLHWAAKHLSARRP